MDALTGMKSKRAWQEKEKMLDDQVRQGRGRFAVVVCDINGLKKVNDTIGHEAGDRLIIRAGNYICKTFRYSPIYRIGGDEFAVILEGKDLEEREVLLAELQRKMDNQKDNIEKDIPVSIAVGIAVCESTDSCCAEVFRRADERMYENKVKMKEKQ